MFRQVQRRKGKSSLWLFITIILATVLFIICTTVGYQLFSLVEPSTDLDTKDRLKEENALLADGIRSLIPDSLSKMNSGMHFINEAMISRTMCTTQDSTTLIETEVIENEEVVQLFSVTSKEYQYRQLCLGSHSHPHSIAISLDSSVGDCDFYLSASNESPSNSDWDWRSNESRHRDSIIIYSYAKEFQQANSQSIFIGIIGKLEENRCKLKVTVSAVSTEELLRKSNSLRGGQILLPRDVKQFMNSRMLSK